jgi:Mn2+/Fe2+ NRAMP family transporter
MSELVAAKAVLALSFATYFQRDDAAGGAAACGCLGFFGLIIIAFIALNIALLVWVAKDAKNRGMDNAVLWMILVMVTGFIGFIIYILVRPQGNLVPCPHCGNKRLQVSAKCTHCGNS